MSLYLNAIDFAATFLILVLVSLVLRKIGMIQKSDSTLIAQLIVNVVLPALLVDNLSKVSVSRSVLQDASTFFAVEVFLLILSYAVGSFLLRLPKASLGVFILCSTIGSTAILGVSYISFIFNADNEAVAKGLLISQLAVGLPAYIFCPIIAMWAGKNRSNRIDWLKQCKQILTTPTIIAIVLGLSWTWLNLPTHGGLIGSLFAAMDLIGKCLDFLVALLLGLTVQRIPLNKNLPVILCCSAFILILEPVLLYNLQTALSFSAKDIQITYFLASMPAAYTIIAYAVRYQADVTLAATLVVSTQIISVITIPSMMPFLSVFNH